MKEDFLSLERVFW